MKQKMYYVGSDDQDGYNVDVYATQEGADQHRRGILDAQCDKEDEGGKEVHSLMDRGMLEMAWDLWNDKIRQPHDYYFYGDREVEMPVKTVNLEVAQGIVTVMRKPKGVRILIRDYDIQDEEGAKRGKDGYTYKLHTFE